MVVLRPDTCLTALGLSNEVDHLTRPVCPLPRELKAALCQIDPDETNLPHRLRRRGNISALLREWEAYGEPECDCRHVPRFGGCGGRKEGSLDGGPSDRGHEPDARTPQRSAKELPAIGGR